MTELPNLPKYKCHKIVQAAKIKGIEENGTSKLPCFGAVLHLAWGEGLVGCFRPVTPEWMEKHKPEEGGYFVVYEDGYQSYSPAEAFETGYSPFPPHSVIDEVKGLVDQINDEMRDGGAVDMPMGAPGGSADRETIYPRRRIGLTVEHPTVGDDFFSPLVNQALLEWMGKYPQGEKEGEDFTASNGVHIKCQPAPMMRYAPKGRLHNA